MVTIGTSAYDALARHASQTPIFAIRELWWKEDSESRTPYIGIFIGPLLISLKTCAIKVSGIVAPALSSLPKTLEKLDLSDMGHSGEYCGVSATISDSICHWKRLRKICCGNGIQLSGDAIRHLASSPTVRELGIRMDCSEIAEVLSDTPEKSAFPCLRHISFDCLTMTSFSRLFPRLGTSLLESLHIPRGQLSSATELHMFFQSLCYLSEHESFTSLNISLDNNPTLNATNVPNSPAHVISGMTLEPLQVFKNLTHLILDVRLPFDLDNDALRDMAICWPRLQNLRFGGELSIRRRSRITLHGLILLVEHCPYLCELAIVITAFLDEPYSTRKQGTGIYNEAITCLDLGSSSCRGMDAVAAFLYDLFPNLLTIRVARDGGPPWGDLSRWRLVVSKIQAMRDMNGTQ
jgi:hypothetical protein